MIEVKIGTSTRNLNDITPSWINEQINRRKEDGAPVCVRVVFTTATLNIGLSSSECARSGGGTGRPFNSQEQEIIDLWNRSHLNENDFSGGNLVAFIKQLESLV